MRIQENYRHPGPGSTSLTKGRILVEIWPKRQYRLINFFWEQCHPLILPKGSQFNMFPIRKYKNFQVLLGKILLKKSAKIAGSGQKILNRQKIKKILDAEKSGG